MSGSLFGPTSPKGGGGGAGGVAATLTVQDEGVTVDSAVTLMDFVGPVVQVTSTGVGQVQVTIGGPPGMWAGSIPAGSFSGTPLKATVAFGSPHPSGTSYSIAVEDIANPGTSFDMSIENKTANGFVVNLNSNTISGLIELDWQVQPHGTATGPTGSISLPGVQNFLVVDKGSNTTEDGSQQFPFHTIQQALAVAAPGELILVYPGTYTEQITPVNGVCIRGVDRYLTILENLGSGIGDSPIATIASQALRVENMTVRATQAGGLIQRLTTSQETVFKDVALAGQIEVLGDDAVVELLDDTRLDGQIAVTGGNSGTRIDVEHTEVVATASLSNAIVIDDPDPVITVKRSELFGYEAINGGNEAAIYWTSDNDNVRLAWSKVMHGSSSILSPFERAGLQTPTYKSHHCAYNADPEASGAWTNAVPVGQRFDTLSNVARF